MACASADAGEKECERVTRPIAAFGNCDGDL
jgi:hypothetical protein